MEHIFLSLFSIWCFLSVETESETCCYYQILRYVYLGGSFGFPYSLHSDLFWLMGTFTLLLYLFTSDTKLVQVWGVCDCYCVGWFCCRLLVFMEIWFVFGWGFF